jgi:protein TonB
MNGTAIVNPWYRGTGLPLDWRRLALVLAAHAAVVAALIQSRATVDKMTASTPIFAEILLPERGEPVDQTPEPPPPDVTPKPPTPPPRPLPRQPDPEPRLAIPEAALAPADSTVATPTVEPAPESAEPVPNAPPVQTPSEPVRASLDSLPGSPDDVRKYIAAIMRELHRHKTYPRELKKAKVEGTLVVQFTIDRHGHLLASDVKQSSGHPELDRAAMAMLARADPLPAIPDFMNRDELALAIPVEYSLITDR